MDSGSNTRDVSLSDVRASVAVRAVVLFGLVVGVSGHTHAGQIFPFNFFVRLQQPVVRGLERVNGIAVYTHAGTGYWGPPMRVGPAPEIAELTLVPAP